MNEYSGTEKGNQLLVCPAYIKSRGRRWRGPMELKNLVPKILVGIFIFLAVCSLLRCVVFLIKTMF